jgi:transcriptional regulator with XRE-family HTH domain
MPAIGRLPFDPFPKATPAQLLAFLKVLGIEQRHVATRLGVSPQLVSFWARGARPIPAKYRMPLRAWAQREYLQALERQQHAAATLPTDALRHAALAVFEDPILLWALEVFHTSGVAEQALRRNLRQLRQYEDREAWTAADIRDMQQLFLVCGIQLKEFLEHHEEAMSEASGQ